MMHHTFNRIYKLSGGLIITLAIVLLILRFATPYFLPTKLVLSTWITKELHTPTEIDQIKLSWQGFSPAITLTHVQILTPNNKIALTVDKMKLLLNVGQLFFRRLQLDEMVIEGVDVGIEYRSPGRLAIAKMPELEIDLNELSSNQQLPLLKRLIVEKSKVRLKVGQQQNVPFNIEELIIENDHILKIRGKTKISGTDSMLNFGADFPRKSSNALLYCHWHGQALRELAHLFPQELPLDLQEGILDLRAWLQLKETGKDLTAQIQLNKAQVKNKNQEMLSLKSVKGWLKVEQKDKNWTLTGKKWQIDDGRAFDFLANKTDCEGGQCWELNTQHIQLETWRDLLDKSNLLPEKLAENLKAYHPKGLIEYVHLCAIKNDQGVTPTQVELVFKNAGMKAGKTHPGIFPISGAIIFNGKQGKMFLESKSLQLHHPELFLHPLDFSNLVVMLEWEQTPEKTMIKTSTLNATFEDSLISGEGTLQFTKELKFPDVEWLVHLDKIKARKALNLLPRVYMDHDLNHWLDKAILDGEMLSTTVSVRGNLNDFPFKEGNGSFEVLSDLDKVHLDYASPWPALSEMKATLLFHNQSLQIAAQDGKISAGGQLQGARAIIPDLTAPICVLTVDSQILSNLQNGVAVLQKGPLKDSLAKKLAPLSLQGDMKLSLNLSVPLSTKNAQGVKVEGLIDIHDASLDCEWDIAVQGLAGEVSFTENSIQSDKLQGLLFASPTQFHINTLLAGGEPQIQILAKGRLAVDKFAQWLRVPNISQVSGETDYGAQLIFSMSPDTTQTSLQVNTALEGITIAAPFPFAKSAQETRDFEFKMYFDPNEAMRLTAEYGDDVNVAYSFISHGNHWHGVGGHVHFGQNRLAKHREDQVLLIDGDLEKFDFKQWKEFLAPMEGYWVDKSLKPQSAPLIEPLIEMNVGTLSLYGLDFSKTKVEAQWEASNTRWNFHFDGPMLKGHAVFPQGEDNRDIIVDLQKLIITKNVDNAAITSNENLKEGIHSIDIKINELAIEKKIFHEIQARIEPSWRGYFFPNINLKMKGTTANFFGNWDYLTPDKKVSLEGKILTKDIGETLDALGIKGTLRAAKGTLNFAVLWNGSPVKIDYPSLGGQADFLLKNGYVHGVNPGIGRVLSLLNINNVQRRLNLDFSDVTKNGFAFDELKGKFQFGKGKVVSNKITLNGPSAKIEAFGQAELEKQGLNGEMIVMPNLTGSLPVAAAIAAGNPAVGAAVWVADKMLGNKIQQIHRYRYKVIGTWQSPLVEEIPMGLALTDRG